MPQVAVFWVAIVLGGGCLGGRCPIVAVVLGGSFCRWQLSGWQLSCVAAVLGGSVLGGSCPSGSCPGGNCPRNGFINFALFIKLTCFDAH